MGEIARLSGVLFEPSAAFRDISTYTRWWPPLAIIAVLSLGFIFMFSQRVGFDRFVRQQMESNPKIQQMDPAQREQAVAVSMKITPVIVYIAAVAALPVITLIVSAVFLLIFRTFLGAAVTFGQVFAVCCYALVPYVLSSIMGFAILILKDPDQFDLQNATPTNIGAFLDSTTTPKWEYSLAMSIDVFTLWVLVLIATGLSVASRKVSWATAMTCVVGSWALWVLIKVGLTAVFS